MGPMREIHTKRDFGIQPGNPPRHCSTALRIVVTLSISLALFLFSLHPATALAQSENTQTVLPSSTPPSDANVRVPPFSEIITDLPKDLKIFGQETLTPEAAPIVVGVLGMTAVQVITDFQTWQAPRLLVDDSNTARKLANYGVSMGDGYFQFGIVGGLAGVGFATGNAKLLRTASQTTEAILATGIVVQVIKHITGRESPFSSEDRTGVWRMFPNQAEYMKDFQKYDAVPSGHLSTAVTTFVVIQENYPEQKWIPFIGWPIIGLVGYGLAGTSIHWWSDFPIAVAIGYSFGKIITRENRPRPDGLTSKRSPWTPTLLPTISNTGEPILMAGWAF